MKCNKLLCLDNQPQEYGKLFFGDYGNFGRLDKLNFEVFKNLAEASESNVWFMNEIDYTKDRKDWDRLPEEVKSKFHKNILYQNAMDSLVPNIFAFMSEISTDTWLSYVYSRISTEEQIHALSYSSGLTQVFGAEATNMLDYIYTDKMLKRRTEKEIEDATRFIETVFKQGKDGDEAKKLILQVLARVFLLEGVKFPFSFFVTWTINKGYKNALQGFSQALRLIAHDELTFHVPVGKNVLNILRTKEEQEFKHLFDSGWFQAMFTEMAKETAELEIEWSNYLLEDGNIPGFNHEIGEHFIKYFTDLRLTELKCTPIYNEKKSDIIDWFNDYKDLNKIQVALQEADATNYQKGKLKNDFDSYDWSRFDKGNR